MRDLLSQFRDLDPKDPGAWPALPKLISLIVVFVAIVALGYVFDTENQMVDLSASKDQEIKLKESYMQKKNVAVNIVLYRKRLKDIDVSFGELLRQLPDKSQVDRLVTDINKAGVDRGLQFELFRPALAEEKKDFYAELPISITVLGSYHKLGAFSADIAQLPRIVTLNDLSITSGKDGLVMNAVAKTFRYLNDTEIAEQKKLRAAKKTSGNAPTPAAPEKK
jgi:type IV pilus assembly protein PilO